MSFLRRNRPPKSVQEPDMVAQSWLWKRIPRTSDRDKASFRRLINKNFHSALYQKRWFQFHPDEGNLSYYREQPLGESEKLQPAGSIHVSQMISVQRKRNGVESTAPSPSVFDVVCETRTYCLCAPDEATMLMWINKLSEAIAIETRTKKRAEGLNARRSSMRDSKISAVKSLKQTQRGSIEKQTTVVATLSEAMEQEYWTGNLPPEALSLYSDRAVETFAFYQMLIRCTKHRQHSPRAEVDRLLQHSTYRFIDEGDTLHQIGSGEVSQVQMVYLLLEGIVVRVKHMGNEEIPLGTVQAGQWIGATEYVVCGTWISNYVCETNCVIIECPISAFQELIDNPDFPTLKDQIASDMSLVVQQTLMGLPLFEDVAEATMFDISRHFKMKYYDSGEVLFEEGDSADGFYIVVVGIANSSKVVDGESVLMMTSRPGDYFGELGLLKNQPRGLKAESLSGLVCIEVDRKGFDNVLHLGGSILQRRIKDHVGEQMNNFIKGIDIFMDLESYIPTIAEGMSFKHLGPGKVVAHQGEPLDGFYSIASGTVSRVLEFVETSYDLEGRPHARGTSRIQVAGDLDLPLELGQLSGQDTFGDVSQLYRNTVAPVTYLTKSPCLLFFIPRAHFQKLLSICPELKRRLNIKHKFEQEERRQFQMKADSLVRALAEIVFSNQQEKNLQQHQQQQQHQHQQPAQQVPTVSSRRAERRRSMSSLETVPRSQFTSSSIAGAQKLAHLMKSLPKDLAQAASDL